MIIIMNNLSTDSADSIQILECLVLTAEYCHMVLSPIAQRVNCQLNDYKHH